MAGSVSSAAQTATFTAINTIRALAGLDPVSEDKNLSANAQQAALIIMANSAVTHHPATNSKCYTYQGGNASATSNLVLGATGARAVTVYMEDPGTSNQPYVGHRRWLLKPQLATMGSGSTNNSNAIQVIGGRINSSATNPTFIPWPTAGYFPAQWAPNGMSWSVSSVGADFSNATVKVTKNGTTLSTSTFTPNNSYGVNTLVWQRPTMTTPANGTVDVYQVTVSGVRGVSKSSYTYQVKLYQVLETFLGGNVNTRVTPGGAPDAGSTVRYVSASYGPSGAQLSFQWTRNGRDISGATGSTYTLTWADRCLPIGLKLTVSMTGAVSSSGTFDNLVDWGCSPPATLNLPGVGTLEVPFSQIALTPDVNDDGLGEILAVDQSGDLVVYPFSRGGTLATPGQAGVGFTTSTVYAPGDWNRDGKADLLTVTPNGKLYLLPGQGKGVFGSAVEIGHGWTGYRIIPSGDLTRDGNPDLLAIDSKGLLWVYAGNGKGAFKPGRLAAGRGWVGLNLYAAGDLNRDGRSDILMVNPTTGDLYSYAGRGNGTFGAATKVGHGWTGLTLVAGSDLNGDGRGDIVGRTQDGRLLFYAGRGNGSFKASTQIGTGW
ncbi:MAG: FG-GAP-like repeat-containing protein [Bifidobacteriaceae bacterium]|nr:FG-GAP-like repeat-containing protein [Bifidobacteriaceae bacterium]